MKERKAKQLRLTVELEDNVGFIMHRKVFTVQAEQTDLTAPGSEPIFVDYEKLREEIRELVHRR